MDCRKRQVRIIFLFFEYKFDVKKVNRSITRYLSQNIRQSPKLHLRQFHTLGTLILANEIAKKIPLM